MRLFFVMCLGLAACGGGGGGTSADGAVADAGVADGASVDAVSPAANCAATFGTALPAGFGRLDGTVVAVVTPADQQCAMPNGTHVVIQIAMGGAVYREVVNVLSDNTTDPDVRFAFFRTGHRDPPWAEGFHAGVTLDYASDLGLHANTAPFVATPMNQLLAQVVGHVTVGQHISVYASGTGGSSAHLVHRNGNNDDGAIVVMPDGPYPAIMVFHFGDQAF